MLRTLSSICLFTFAALASADQPKLQAAIDSDHRTAAWITRDQYRNPLETLSLFDVQPGHTVVEVFPGGGWYTEILAPYLREDGQLIAAHFDSEDTQADYRPGSRQRFEEKMSADPKVYDRVKVSSLWFDEEGAKLLKSPADSGSVDRVLTFRSMHGLFAADIAEVALAEFFDLLKPGGKLGVVQHMADPGQDWLSENIGYVGRDTLIAVARSVGFELLAEGFFNRNPLDTKRYYNGVWQLPPSLWELETDAQKAPYLAIGESERMTLVFLKP
ncbi:MAG: methyltransferase [Pseudomonadota bacterium]